MNKTRQAIEQSMSALRHGSRDIQATLEQRENRRESLERKWARQGILEGLSDSRIRRDIAQLLENQTRAASGYMASASQNFPLIQEDFSTSSFASFDKFAFPVIRALFPQLAATELVTVQPMDGPSSMIFFMDYIYGTTKGSVTSGTKLFENPNASYSSETIDEEDVGTGDGGTANFTGTLSYTPIHPGSITISSVVGGSAVTVTDDGIGNLVGDIAVATNTIDYTTGEFDVTFSGNVDNLIDVLVVYDYDLEAQTSIPKVDLVLSSASVMARPRKLKTMYSFEAEQDLRSLHGMEASVELAAEITTELRFEIDLDVVIALWNGAYDPPTSELPDWNKNPSPGVSWRDHKTSFKDILITASSIVNKRTGRANPNWIVAGYDVADVIESQDDFVPEPGVSFQGRGVRKIGTWRRWAVYLNPAMDQLSGGSHKHFLVGYKGGTFFDTGYVYAPYVPLYATPDVVLDDFMVRKGLATRYGKRMVNSDFYLRGKIIES